MNFDNTCECPYPPPGQKRYHTCQPSFVFGAWCAGACLPRDVLHRMLREGARCVLMVGPKDPKLFMGWAVVAPIPQTVIWAYVKPKARNNGLMVALLDHLGIDTTKPMTALFRSPASDGMIRRGWQIEYLTAEPDNDNHQENT